MQQDNQHGIADLQSLYVSYGVNQELSTTYPGYPNYWSDGQSLCAEPIMRSQSTAGPIMTKSSAMVRTSP